MIEGLFDSCRGNLVEDDPPHELILEISGLEQVPRNGLALPVRVSGKVNGLGVLERGLELLDYLFLSGWNDVCGLEPIVNLHAQFARR
jgi:hypothetical protein